MTARLRLSGKAPCATAALSGAADRVGSCHCGRFPVVTISIEHEHLTAARQRLSLRRNPLLRPGELWFSTPGWAPLSLRVGQLLCTGVAQQVWKNASLPWFGRLGCPGLVRRTRLALWALCHDPERSRALRRPTGCGDGPPAKNRMSFAQGCFLSGTANLEGLPSVFEEGLGAEVPFGADQGWAKRAF